LHAWDHHYWQTRIDSLSQSDIKAEIQKGGDLLTDILGKIPDCFAAPAWQTTTNALLALNEFSFRFQSDCRGHSVFRPDIDGLVLKNIQVPATLPTYDELIGLNCTEETYNEYLLNLIRPDKLNILTIHAEVEGIHCFNLFQKFLDMARQKNIVLVPMGEMIPEESEINISTLLKTSQPGREGWLSIQEHYE
jgi:undecaprenyl phosphate-alpha-L-ara4FN deformylase